VNNIEEEFNKIKNSTNPEKINDFLLELVNIQDITILGFLDHFLANTSLDIFEKIKINLVYALGHVGSFEIIDIKYQDFLIEEYFKSDRWVRNEIIRAFELISHKNPLTNKIENVLEYSLFDDYNPIKISSLSLLLTFKGLSQRIEKNLFKIQNFSDSNTIEIYSKVLRKFYNEEKDIFDFLNSDNEYKSLNKSTFRTLLLIFFKSILNLEFFRDLILDSDWELQYKEVFLREIYTFEKILLKRTY